MTRPAAPTDRTGSTFSLIGIVPALLIVGASVALVGWLVYAGTRSPTTSLTAETLTIRGLYSTTISRANAVHVSLLDALPARPGSRTGFAAAGHLRGDFDIGPLGRCRLFVTLNTPPYIVIHTTTRPVIVNFSDPSRTHALYEELQTMWAESTVSPEDH